MPPLADDLRASYNPRVAEVLAKATVAAPSPSLLGMQLVEQSPGHVRCKLEIGDKHKSGIGLVHGGVLTAMVDHVLSIVVYPHVEIGKWVATLDMAMNYLAPVREGEILATADILSMRRRVAVVRVELHNVRAPGSEPVLVAAATGTVYVKDAPQKKAP
jgi:1,4-dihydroxy-2-naphthoyl-CoA hydrolase